MEASLVARVGIAFEAIPAAGLHGVGLRALPGNLWSLARGLLASRRVLQRFKPDVLFLTGGYVSVPVALAGWRLPKLAYVPDIEPGLALRLISRSASKVAVTVKDSVRYYPRKERVIVSGYPVRRALMGLGKETAAKLLGVDASRSIVLVFGGSRGARSINEALWAILPSLLERTQVLHITGALDWPRVSRARLAVPASLAGDYHPFEYLHEEMGAVLSVADLAVSRAGASVLGEYPAFGLPSVLVPYPHAWRYQRVNAEYLVDRGAAVQIADEELGTELLKTLLGLLEDPRGLAEMRAAARRLATPAAAKTIAVELERLARREAGLHG